MQLNRIRVIPNKTGIVQGLVSKSAEIEHWRPIGKCTRPNQPGIIVRKGDYKKVRVIDKGKTKEEKEL